MEKITSISQLPDWFRKRTYHKRLSDVDWFREIRKRQKLFSSIELDDWAEPASSPLAAEMRDESRKLLLDMLEMDNVPADSLIYLVPQEGFPIRELTVGEAAFLSFPLRHSDASEVVDEYKKLLETWCNVLRYREAVKEQPLLRSSWNYDRELASFIDHFDNDSKLDSPVETYSEYLGNPWLSYGRPLNGYPLTIDTQFDDQTILQHVKDWLVEKRKTESSKARRPFNQNDFDDWEYYKIRELFDLQTWATINGTKILDRVMADALWPNAPDNFSPIDVLRTTARKKADEVFQFETVVRLYGQLRLDHGENFLIE